ncbi:FAD-binding oxidoreductase [Marivita sp. XM-24bin2]|jgi:D-arginine dehydrogenase|uniref:NAD(P)/FAD-dependent oxidoreductase n=1 Tax=unclassified Marivita TaxID=2632480 RepID=UPI000D79F064|nr:FAD-binding oxidoreductase [Marivita sp. XM-24bin2]MCR9110653.1 FAD-binding oxidoreductase [Paracoccaceae bacterium]PWL34005.1 MAG: glycerol-3-phosphate dehydrogenase [Marivita sp. XM-24bin2]
MSDTADIIVIGGGIAGISAAAELARDVRVVVVEGEAHLGYHATGRSAAIYVRNYGNATLRALNALSHAPLAGELLGQNVLYPRGELLIAKRDEASAFEAHLADTDGIERLTPAEVTALVPILRKERILGGAIERDAQDIDVDRLLQGCVRLLRDRGGTIRQGAPVTKIQRDASGWTVETATSRLSAPIVVNAAGAWADHIAAMAGVRPIGLQPMRRSAVIMALPDDIAGHKTWPLFGSIHETWYAKPMAPGLMISPADEDPVDPQDAWPDDMVLAEGLYRFEEMVDIPITRPLRSWAGLRSFVPDRSPVVGFAPDAEGFFWLAAQGGYGVQTSPALAHICRTLCLAQSSDIDPALLASLSPARLMT